VIAGRIVAAQVVDANLAIETNRCARDQRFVMMDAGPIDCMPGGEVVGAVEHQVSTGDERVERLAGKPLLQRHDLDFRVGRAQCLLAGFCLGHADAVLGMENLPLQVGEINGVVINQGDFADASRCKVERRW